MEIHCEKCLTLAVCKSRYTIIIHDQVKSLAYDIFTDCPIMEKLATKSNKLNYKQLTKLKKKLGKIFNVNHSYITIVYR